MIAALQKYGMILADGGQDAFTAEAGDFYASEGLSWSGVLAANRSLCASDDRLRRGRLPGVGAPQWGRLHTRSYAAHRAPFGERKLERVVEWVIKWVVERKLEWVIEWVVERKLEWIVERKLEWIVEWVERKLEWVVERKLEWIVEWVIER